MSTDSDTVRPEAPTTTPPVAGPSVPPSAPTSRASIARLWPFVRPEARQLVATTNPAPAAAPLGGGLQFNLFETPPSALAQAA